MTEPQRPPKELRRSGREVWTAVVEHLDLDRHEMQVLLETCRTADRLDALAADIEQRGTLLPVMGSLGAPFAIMFSLPLALVGAVGALAVTHRALGLPALFGLLMLVGIVVSNGIVLIDFVQQLRRRGMSPREALLEGGRLRLRPVLMTAAATIVALAPMSLGLTEGAIIAAELATVVIGGLLTSTLMTLVVVPVVYTFITRAGPRRAG